MGFLPCAAELDYCQLDQLSTVVLASPDWDRISTDNTVSIISSGNVYCSVNSFGSDPLPAQSKACYYMPCTGTECPSIASITQNASPQLSAFSDLWPWTPAQSMDIGVSLTLLLSVGFCWRAAIKSLNDNERSHHEEN